MYHFNHTSYYLFKVNYTNFNKKYVLVSQIWKFKKLNLKTSVLQCMNVTWFLNELPAVSVVGSGAQLTRKKWTSENLVITKCISSVYFIVGFVLQWIHCDPDPRKVCWIDATANCTNSDALCKRFSLLWCFSYSRTEKGKCCSARQLLKEFYHRQWSHQLIDCRKWKG